MFELVTYVTEENGAILRCECGGIKTIILSDIESYTEKYCMLKENQKLTCPHCGKIHTDKIICKEQQTFSHINIPTCPTCGSTNVSKITTASKAIGFAAVGVFSSNFGKTMHCKQCGYKW